jgi:prevent-host-death family protein
MDFANGIEPVTVLKTRSAELIRQARESGQPIIITQNGKPTAVLQDVESFQRQREALTLLKILAKGDQELSAGDGIGHDEVLQRIERKLKHLQKAEAL